MACIACPPCCLCCDGLTCVCTACCPNLIPKVLHGTIVDVNNCGCLPAQCTFIWDGTNWVADLGACCGDADRTLILQCNVTNWALSGSRNGGAGGGWFSFPNVVLVSCCPVMLTADVTAGFFNNLGPGPTCQGQDSGHFQITITQ